MATFTELINKLINGENSLVDEYNKNRGDYPYENIGIESIVKLEMQEKNMAPYGTACPHIWTTQKNLTLGRVRLICVSRPCQGAFGAALG